jgi:hypothetical protein
MRGLITGVALFTLAQALIWFQTNGQFIWPWFKRNPIILSITGGTIISYIFIYATRYVAEYYDGSIWPGRFIGFACGIITFTTITYFMMDEGITTKTLLCIILSFGILCIQVFWK